MRICIIGYDSWVNYKGRGGIEEKASVLEWLKTIVGYFIVNQGTVNLSYISEMKDVPEINQLEEEYCNLKIWNKYSSPRALIRDCDIFLFLRGTEGYPSTAENKKLEKIIKRKGKTIIYY
jgi:hypothetical protein